MNISTQTLNTIVDISNKVIDSNQDIATYLMQKRNEPPQKIYIQRPRNQHTRSNRNNPQHRVYFSDRITQEATESVEKRFH